jgi:hypothetical protein
MTYLFCHACGEGAGARDRDGRRMERAATHRQLRVGQYRFDIFGEFVGRKRRPMGSSVTSNEAATE